MSNGYALDEDAAQIVLGVAVVLVAAVVFVAAAKAEANTFNRCTGSHVTWTDALFVELRVENCQR